MRLIVQRCDGAAPQFRAWLRDEVTATQVELPGVYEVIGWADATAQRMDVLPPAQQVLQDGATVEGSR